MTDRPSSISRVVPQATSALPQRSRTFDGESFGMRLFRLRRNAGLSQRELGQLTAAAGAGNGISYAYISRIEAGARDPSVKAIRLMATALGVSPTYLEFGYDPPGVDVDALDIKLGALVERLNDLRAQVDEAITAAVDLRYDLHNKGGEDGETG